MVTVVIMVMVVIMVVIMAVVAVMVSVIAVETAVPIIMPVAWHIFPVVPIVPNKEDGPTTGVILAAVARPVLLVSRRHMQVDGLVAEGWIPVNHHGTRIDQCGRLRHFTNIDLAEEPRLANVDGHPDIRGHRRRGNEHSNQNEALHDVRPWSPSNDWRLIRKADPAPIVAEPRSFPFP